MTVLFLQWCIFVWSEFYNFSWYCSLEIVQYILCGHYIERRFHLTVKSHLSCNFWGMLCFTTILIYLVMKHNIACNSFDHQYFSFSLFIAMNSFRLFACSLSLPLQMSNMFSSAETSLLFFQRSFILYLSIL